MPIFIKDWVAISCTVAFLAAVEETVDVYQAGWAKAIYGQDIAAAKVVRRFITRIIVFIFFCLVLNALCAINGVYYVTKLLVTTYENLDVVLLAYVIVTPMLLWHRGSASVTSLTEGLLLRENLPIQRIPFEQRRKLTMSLSGGDEWKLVAEKLGLTPVEIRFYDKRTIDPAEAMLEDIAQRRPITVGNLRDVLNECELPLLAGILK